MRVSYKSFFKDANKIYFYLNPLNVGQLYNMS